MNKDILGTFKKFTDGYALRDAEKIDEFMGGVLVIQMSR